MSIQTEKRVGSTHGGDSFGGETACRSGLSEVAGEHLDGVDVSIEFFQLVGEDFITRRQTQKGLVGGQVEYFSVLIEGLKSKLSSPFDGGDDNETDGFCEVVSGDITSRLMDQVLHVLSESVFGNDITMVEVLIVSDDGSIDPPFIWYKSMPVVQIVEFHSVAIDAIWRHSVKQWRIVFQIQK